MINKEVILRLLEYPLDCEVYVGKGMGPVGTVTGEITDRLYVVISPEPGGKRP